MQRSTSESGRRITLDGDELCDRGSVCVCVCVLCCVCLSVCVCVCVCQILRENKPKERNGHSRRYCAGLEVGRGPVRGVKMCALMHVLHAAVQGTDESREMVVVLRMLLSLSLSPSLSLSHTHTHK